MVYIDPNELKWEPYVRTWIASLPKFNEEQKEKLLNLFLAYVENGLKWVRKNGVEIMKQVGHFNVLTLERLDDVYVISGRNQQSSVAVQTV